MNQELAVTPRRVLRWTGLAIAAWLVSGMATAAQYHEMQQASGVSPSWSAILRTSLASDLLWVPFTVMALLLAFTRPLAGEKGKRLQNLGWHGAGLVAVVAGRAGAVIVLNDWIGWYPSGVPPLRDLLVTSVVNNLALHTLLTGLAHAVYFAALARAREQQFHEARMAAVSAQLQPHFLFNALNAIAELVHRDPRVAERMIVDLAALLRHSLAVDSERVVRLETELEIAAAYLDIEEHRFADRLQVSWDVDPAVRGARGSALPAAAAAGERGATRTRSFGRPHAPAGVSPEGRRQRRPEGGGRRRGVRHGKPAGAASPSSGGGWPACEIRGRPCG